MHYIYIYAISSLRIKVHRNAVSNLVSYIPVVQRTRCTCFRKLLILAKRSACFERSFHHQELKTAYTATVCVKQLLLPGMRWNSNYLFLQSALHVLNGISVHHQELKTAYTATVYVKQVLLPAATGDEMKLKLFIFAKRSTCFERSFRPSSGAENCVYSNGMCQTAAATRDEMKLKLFIFAKRSTCFERSFRPSSGAENCVYSNGICQTGAATCCYRGWDGTHEVHLVGCTMGMYYDARTYEY